jgi:hypothetical protein
VTASPTPAKHQASQHTDASDKLCGSDMVVDDPARKRTSVELRSFHVDNVRGSDELASVAAIANQLLHHLNSPRALRAIAAANRPGASSHKIQHVFRDFILNLGFADESRVYFESTKQAVCDPTTSFDSKTPESFWRSSVARRPSTMWIYPTSGNAISAPTPTTYF